MRRAVVLLHGFAGSAATFDGVRAALGDEFACSAPSLLGHGAAPPAATGHGEPSAIGRYEDEVDRLAASLPAAPLLVGYSFGGRLAMGLVARHAARIAGAIFVGAHPGLPDAAARQARAADDARWSTLLRREGLEPFIAAWEAQPLFASQAALPEAVRLAQRTARRSLDAVQLAEGMDRLGLGAMPCWTEALQRAATPMTFVAGEQDGKYAALGQALAASVPAMRYEVAPGAGHNVVLERPDVIAAAVRGLAAG